MSEMLYLTEMMILHNVKNGIFSIGLAIIFCKLILLLNLSIYQSTRNRSL